MQSSSQIVTTNKSTPNILQANQRCQSTEWKLTGVNHEDKEV